MTFALPITDPVLIVALAMAAFLVVPPLFERLRLPGIIGLIVAGAVLGPHGAGLLARDATIVLLGTVGLLYLVFLAGLELDLERFREYRRLSLGFGLLSFGLPMLLGSLAMPALGYGVAGALLIGSILGSHTLLAYPIVSRLGLARQRAVTTVVGGTLVTDTLALTALAVISAIVGGAAGAGAWARLLGGLALFVALVWWGVPWLGHWFFQRVPMQTPPAFVFLLAVLFVVAYLAQLAGAQPIIGAFLAGLTLNRLVPEPGALMNRVRFVGNTVFVPFFLLSVGMLVDVRVLTGGTRVWVLAGALWLLLLLGKSSAVLLSARLFGYARDEAGVMLGLSLPQAAATLAVTFVGLEIGLFEETLVNAVIVLILVSCLVGSFLVERYGRELARREEQAPLEAGAAPRVLIPISNPATASALLDLAFILRGANEREALYPLMVVPQDGDSAEAQVAEAERMLSHAVSHASAAAVPVVPLTRVDRNIAAGIARGIAETRSSTVIIGWDGRASARGGIFGSVLDQLLAQSRQLVLVAKLGHPLNITRRLVLVLPPGSDHHPGYEVALRATKQLAVGLGAEVLGLVVHGPSERYAQDFQRLTPPVRSAFRALTTWGELMPALTAELRPDDLAVLFSARPGTLPWHRELDRLPARLAELAPHSFVVLYPPEAAAAGAEPEAPSELPPWLTPACVVAELPALPYREALQRLLDVGWPAGLNRVPGLADTLARTIEAYSVEMRPGVAVPHARVPELGRTLLFLGISPEGVTFPHAGRPAHLIFLLLSPAEQPREHLEALAELARLASSPARVADLLARHAPAASLEWMNVGKG